MLRLLMMSVFIVGLWFFPPLVHSRTKLPNKGTPSALQVYALEYGQSWYPARFVVNRRWKTRSLRFSWQFFVLRWKRRVLLIDAGMPQARLRRRFGIKQFRHPQTLLKKLGLSPAQVTDILLTHHHVDHAGGLALFPKAKVHLHPLTLRVLQRSRTLPKVRRWLKKATKEKRVHLIRKRWQWFRWLEFRWIGGHTGGSLVALVRLPLKTLLFVGDECYLQRFCRRGWGLPPASRANRRRNLRFLKELKARSQKGEWLPFPAHDPQVMKRYPKVAPGVVRLRGRVTGDKGPA